LIVMDFLIDASLPRAVSSVVQKLGHSAHDVRDLGMTSADDSIIAAYAQSRQLCLISRDFDFGDIRNYPPNQYSGLVVVELPSTASATQIAARVEAFLQLPDILPKLAGRLAIVELSRVRLRPPP
jgi:predicted nuclease of predicted toxin-antitoxin system